MSVALKDDSVQAVDIVNDDVLAQAPKLSGRYADESYKLFAKVKVTDPTPEEARRIRNKCLWRIIPFLCFGYHIMYVDKQTVSISGETLPRFIFVVTDHNSSLEVLLSSELWMMHI